MPKTLSKRMSKILLTYFRDIYVPSKYRWWNIFRKITGYPRLTIPYANNSWITLDERHFHEYQILALGNYENEVWDAIESHVQSDDVVWDIGANIGTFAIVALENPNVKQVHVFEPNKEVFDILEENLTLNSGSWFAHNIAVSNKDGKMQLFREPEPFTSGLVSGKIDWGKGTMTVSSATVDTLVFEKGLERPTILKIDVEDLEEEVLRGSVRLLENNPPRIIVFEALCDKDYNLENHTLSDLLSTNEYRISPIERTENERIVPLFPGKEHLFVDNFIAMKA